MKGFWFALGCLPIIWLFVLPRMVRKNRKETFSVQALAALILAALCAGVVWFAIWCWT